MAPLQRVLPKGCYPFLSGRSGKPFSPPWQAFRLQRRASITTANRSAVALSQSVTTPFADPFAGLKGRDLRDGVTYTEKSFRRQFSVCFIFRRMIYLVIAPGKAPVYWANSKENISQKHFVNNLRREISGHREWKAEPHRQLHRQGTDNAAKRSLSARLCGVWERCGREDGARSG